MITVRLDEAAEWVGKDTRTLKRWAVLGWITPVGRDKRERDLYNLSHIQRCERDVRKGQPHQRLRLLAKFDTRRAG